jgi:peptidoglycan hydrolase-like protein with peptidoglycan-binding domain
VSQLLAQLGQVNFPNVDPNKAAAAGASLFDSNSIKWVQGFLQLEADGINGESTKAAVKKYQEAHGLKVDGWAGHLTQETMRAQLKEFPR